MMILMATATALPAAPLEAVACMRKVNNAHCILTCVGYSVYTSVCVCVLYSNCYMLNMFSMGLTIIATSTPTARRFIFPSSSSFQVIHKVLLKIAYRL